MAQVNSSAHHEAMIKSTSSLSLAINYEHLGYKRSGEKQEGARIKNQVELYVTVQLAQSRHATCHWKKNNKQKHKRSSVRSV